MNRVSGLTTLTRISGQLITISLCIAFFVSGCATRESSNILKTGKDEFVRNLLVPSSGPSVEYYVSVPKQKSPLVIYLQGSGCTPVFPPTGFGSDHASTVFSSTTIARNYPVVVMVINKPYAPRLAPKSAGIANNCPQEFNEYFSLESWVTHIETAFKHARRLPLVDTSRTLVIGTSEGATVAAALAARNHEITDVAIVSGSGPTQFFDFVAGAYASTQDQTKVADALSELDAERVAIIASPKDSKKFAWGHPYKRWSSFFASSSLENLAKSGARIYVVSGMSDTSVPILSTEVLYSELLWKGRDITMRRIPYANHALVREGFTLKEAEAEYDRILQWFLLQH